MRAKQRTEGEVSRAIRLGRAQRGVEELRRAALAAEQEFGAELKLVAPSMRESAFNLAHYLAVRRHDVRELQGELAHLGLSSLGRMEAHVMASLQAVLQILYALRGEPVSADVVDDPPITFDTGAALLVEHTNAILGSATRGHHTRIMVTMPGEAADDPDLIRGLVEDGMGIMRINCAHDSPEIWERMVKHLRQAERDLSKRCLVSFDLAGPKLRTGPIVPGPAVMKWRPARNALGQVTEFARVRLVAGSNQPDAKEPTIPVEAALLGEAKPGDAFAFADARNRKRVLHVNGVHPGECLCETDRTAYVVPGTCLTLLREQSSIAKGEVGALPTVEQSIALRAGDTLEVVRGEAPGRDATYGDDGRVIEPASVSCALAEVFSGVGLGDPILFDDGKIRGVIRDIAKDRLQVEITGVAGGKAKLKAEKGINLPESSLALPALTLKDIDDLAFVAKYGDAVAMSFVQHPKDIDALLREIAASQLGIMLKIETKA